MRKLVLFSALGVSFLLSWLAIRGYTDGVDVPSSPGPRLGVVLGGNGARVIPEIPSTDPGRAGETPPAPRALRPAPRSDDSPRSRVDPVRPAQPGVALAKERTSPARYHVVEGGESLWEIAKAELGRGDRYLDLAAWNGLKDPGAVVEGQVLALQPPDGSTRPGAGNSGPGRNAAIEAPPDSARTREVTVGPGDSLSKIAARHLGNSRRWPEIQKLNSLKDADQIKEGMRLLLPAD